MKRTPVVIAAVLLAAGLAAWWRHAHPPFDMANELKRLADTQDLWDNQFERNAEKAAALLRAARSERDPSRRLSQREEAARQYLLAAQAEPAIALLKQLIDENGDAPFATRETLRFDLALAWLRMGEVQNCVGGKNSESCLIPIQGGGVHAKRLGSLEATRVLTALLADPQASPQLVPTYRWLLNIAAMTLGDWPDKVDPRWLIPASAFASEYPLPKWNEVGLAHGVAINERAGGAILEDFDGDGDLDLLVSAWGLRDPLRYFINDGHGRYTEEPAADLGLQGITGGLDIFQGDYDNDGLPDVFVPRGAWAHKAGQFPGSLLHNDGHGHFTDVTAQAGVLDALPSQAAAWCDLDNDGWLDLVKGNELHQDVDWPKGTRNVAVWRNDAHGHFTDVAAKAGVDVHGMIKAVTCGDYDNDGWMDLYFSVIYGRNVLLHNLGGKGQGLKFEDVTLKAGVAEPIMSFTTWFFDYDNDGWLDLFVTGYQTDMSNLALEYLGEKARAQGARPRIYHNNHDGTFTDLAPQLGADKLTLTMGANFGDLDNDGWPDMYLGTGAPPLQVLDPSRMLRNDHGARFQDVTTAGGFGHLQKGHAVAFGDVDGDGDQDLFEQIGGAFSGDRFWSVLFENPSAGQPGHNDWITLRLHGTKANRSAIGARIRIRETDADGPREIWHTVGSGGTFGANSLQAEIGLGPHAKIESVQIRWPGSGGTAGALQDLSGLAVDRAYEVTEGQAPR